jgi:hypothetical protein
VDNLNKHKPLTTEELFNFLENQSGKESNFEDMDDFEKEALEGFTSQSTPQKTKALTEELNLAISKKASDSNDKGTYKNRIIWFSAAASIALIILLSVFILNQSKQDSETNVVLNDVKEETESPLKMEEQKTLETITNSNSVVDESKVAETTKTQGVIKTKNAEQTITTGLVSEPSIALADKITATGSATSSKDESKSRREYDMSVSENQPIALAEKKESKKNLPTVQAGEKSNTEQEQISGYANTQSISAITSTNEEADKLTYRSDADNRKTKNLEKAAKEQTASDQNNESSVSYTKSSPAPASIPNRDDNVNPYYTGSELAIKEFVLTYLKSKSTTKSIIGKYKITGNVDIKGALKVTSIIQIDKENCNCIEQIKEALNTMKNWHSATKNGKAIPSNVEFILMF